MSTIYLLNSPIVGVLDMSLQNTDVTPLIVTMPPAWNKPKSRIRVRFAGTFQLPQPGDLFFRKLWFGKTQLTFSSSQAIRPNEARFFSDEHFILWYGDNLHAIQSVHHTGLASSGSFSPGEGNSGDSSQFRGACPATTELSQNDAPLIVDGNLNNLSVSIFGYAENKIFYSLREFSVEQLEV